jgi:hypothetical protein
MAQKGRVKNPEQDKRVKHPEKYEQQGNKKDK